MNEFYPLLIVGAIISVFATAFILAFVFMKDKKEAIGFDRNIKDGEIIKRLLVYAKPHIRSFILVGFIMLLSISYEQLYLLLYVLYDQCIFLLVQIHLIYDQSYLL